MLSYVYVDNSKIINKVNPVQFCLIQAIKEKLVGKLGSIQYTFTSSL